MIDSISPFAIAATGLLGMMLMMTSVSGGASRPENVASDCASIPDPIPALAAMKIAVATAMAVVIMYSKNALVPILPRSLMSPIPHTPQIKEKNTSGTTNIFSELTKSFPTT